MRDGGGIQDECQILENQSDGSVILLGERNGKRSGIWVQSNIFGFVFVEVEVMLDYVGGEVLQAIFVMRDLLYYVVQEYEEEQNISFCKEFIVQRRSQCLYFRVM